MLYNLNIMMNNSFKKNVVETPNNCTKNIFFSQNYPQIDWKQSQIFTIRKTTFDICLLFICRYLLWTHVKRSKKSTTPQFVYTTITIRVVNQLARACIEWNALSILSSADGEKVSDVWHRRIGVHMSRGVLGANRKKEETCERWWREPP